MRSLFSPKQIDVIAPRGVLFLSHMIDLFLLQALQLLGAYLGGFTATLVLSYRYAPETVVSEAAATGMIFGWLFWGIVGAALNYLVIQSLFQATLGKAVCGLRVVKLNGSRRVIWRTSSKNVQALLPSAQVDTHREDRQKAA